MADYNFGFIGNGKTCSCGRHQGMGELSAEDRAAFAKRMKETFARFMTSGNTQYLADWEKHHGPVVYEMVFSHQHKGQEIFRAAFVDPIARAAERGQNDMFQKRADING